MEYDHTFDGWEIIERLGVGGMCEVYRVRSANPPSTERAIKVLTDTDSAAESRFADEARLLIALDHPNILRVHQFVAADPPWLVMDLLAGRDLEEIRDSDDKNPPETCARWIADIADGLQQVHNLGIAHRDIKASNIMLGQDGVPKLIDFGIARETDAAHRTAAGMVVGTASYLPPEVFLDDKPQYWQDRPSADIYALGQTLTELLIHQSIHPEDEYAGATRFRKIMGDKIKRPHLDPRQWNPSLPAGLCEIIAHATDQDPEARLPTAADFATRLRQWIEERNTSTSAPISRGFDPTMVPPTPVMLPSVQAPKKNRRIAGLLIVVAVVLGGAVIAGLFALVGLTFLL